MGQQIKKNTGYKEISLFNGRTSCIIVAVFSFLIYGNTILNRYNLDDELVTSPSPTKQHRLTSKGIAAIPEIFKSNYYEDSMGYSYEYRPLVLTTFAIEHSLFGDNPHIGHLINALLYSLLCVLLLSVLTLLLRDYSPLLPLLTTLLFAAFPMHTEVVASLKNRDEILALTGAIASLYFFINYADKEKWIFLAGGVLCFVAAILSKQTIISFIIIIPILLFLFREVSPIHALLIVMILLSTTFPFIQRIYLVDRVGIVAYIFVFTLAFYELRYQPVLTQIKFRGKKYLDKWSLPAVARPRERQSILTAKRVYIAAGTGLLVLSLLVLILGSTYYVVPFSMLIPVLIFFPSNAGKYLLWVSAAIAIYLSYITGQGLVFRWFFFLYAYNYLLRKDTSYFELARAIIISFVGERFIDPHGSALVLACITVMTIKPEFKPVMRKIILMSAIGLAFAGLVGGLMNFQKMYFLIFSFYLAITGCIFIFPQKLKIPVLIISLPILTLMIRHNGMARTSVNYVQQIVWESKFQAEEIKQQAQEIRHRIETRTYTSPVQNISEKTVSRPLDFTETGVSLNSSLSEKLGTALTITGKYLRLTLMPCPMSFYYGYKCIEKTELQKPLPLTVLAIVASLILLALWQVNRNPLLSAGLLVYFIALLPLVNIVAPISGMVADRYLFIPSLGFCILLSFALFKVAKFSMEKINVPSFSSLPQLFKYPALAILVVYSGMTLARNAQWENSLILMRHDIRHLDESAQAHNLLATHIVNLALAEKKGTVKKTLLEEAESHYKKAIEIYPDFFNAWYDLGRVRLMLGKFNEAEQPLMKVIAMDSSFSEPYFQLALVKENKSDYRGAAFYYSKYLQRNPGNLEALMNLSLCHSRMNDMPGALVLMKQAASSNPQSPEPLINQCRIFADMGAIDSAMFYLHRAEVISPNHPDIVLLKNALAKLNP